MPTLYELGAELERLQDLLADAGGEVTDETQGVIEAYFAAEGDTDDKLDAYCAFIAEIEERAKFRRAEAQRLQELARSDENGTKRLRDRLIGFFDLRDWTKRETRRFRLSVGMAGGKQKLDIFGTVPKEFEYTPPPEPDKEAIRSKLESGEELHFARLEPRGRVLRIK